MLSFPRSIRIPARPAFALAASILATTLSGCSLLYENRLAGSGFVIYSDRSPEFVAQIAREVESITNGLTGVFDLSQRRLGSMTIVLHGEDSNVIDYRHSPDLLGFYIPVINYISVNTDPVWSEGDGLIKQVLLHEIAHHYIITLRSEASTQCWLNEGLAGALETSLYDGERFETPLFNPLLFHVASQAARAATEPLALDGLVGKSWSDFHAEKSKEENYALAWSIVYYILERHFEPSQPLALRIRRLMDLDHAYVNELETEWNRFLRDFDETEYFLELSRPDAAVGELTSSWALEQLGLSRPGSDLRALRAIATFFRQDEPRTRRIAYEAYLTRLERIPFSFILENPWVRTHIEHIKHALRGGREPLETRLSLMHFMAESVVYRIDWIPLLIDMLNAREDAVRVAALEALAELATKPTIINPEFWRSAPTERRAAEVSDWKEWWAAEGNTALRTLQND